MKKFNWVPLLLVVMMLFVSACSKTVMENQSSTDQEPQPVAQTEPEPEAVEPAPAPEPEDLEGREEFVTTHVYFDFDSAVLQPDAQELLQVKAMWLKDHPGIAAVLIEGHCDARGTEAYNMALGAQRADAVKQYLTEMGIITTALETQSYGEERPASTGNNEASWAKNRRASFVIN